MSGLKRIAEFAKLDCDGPLWAARQTLAVYAKKAGRKRPDESHLGGFNDGEYVPDIYSFLKILGRKAA